MTRQRRLPDDDLSRWIRALPDTWHLADDELTPEQVDRLVGEIVNGKREPRRRPRRRRRGVAVGAVVAVAMAGGAAAVFALLNTDQPTRPSEATICRAAPDEEAPGVVVDPTSDPIGACREVWESGEFDPYRSDGEVPDLTACVMESGGVAVFPGPPDVCGQLGLPGLEQPLSPENEAILQLNERIVAEINAQPCAPTDEVLVAAERILAETGLDGWSVVVGAGRESAECAKVSVDAPARTLSIFEF